MLRLGTSTTLTLKVVAGAPGAFAGPVIIPCNDPSQAEFRLNVAATVQPVVRYLDDGDPGFLTSGPRTRSRQGYRSDLLVAGAPGAGAQWAFANLTAGVYRVSATW